MCAMSVALEDQGEIVPGRGATTWTSPVTFVRRAAGPVGQELLEHAPLRGSEVGLECGDVHELRAEGPDGQAFRCEILQDFPKAKGRECRGAAKDQHCQGRPLHQPRGRGQGS
jgi:hypothetical protein